LSFSLPSNNAIATMNGNGNRGNKITKLMAVKEAYNFFYGNEGIVISLNGNEGILSLFFLAKPCLSASGENRLSGAQEVWLDLARPGQSPSPLGYARPTVQGASTELIKPKNSIGLLLPPVQSGEMAGTKPVARGWLRPVTLVCRQQGWPATVPTR